MCGIRMVGKTSNLQPLRIGKEKRKKKKEERKNHGKNIMACTIVGHRKLAKTVVNSIDTLIGYSTCRKTTESIHAHAGHWDCF